VAYREQCRWLANFVVLDRTTTPVRTTMSDSPADNNDDDTEAQYHDTIEDDGLIRTDCSAATSQGYQEIAAAEDSASPSRIPFYNRPWIPDTSWHVLGHELVDGVVVVKFLKLLVLTAVGILLTFVFVRVLVSLKRTV